MSHQGHSGRLGFFSFLLALSLSLASMVAIMKAMNVTTKKAMNVKKDGIGSKQQPMKVMKAKKDVSSTKKAMKAMKAVKAADVLADYLDKGAINMKTGEIKTWKD